MPPARVAVFTAKPAIFLVLLIVMMFSFLFGRPYRLPSQKACGNFARNQSPRNTFFSISYSSFNLVSLKRRRPAKLHSIGDQFERTCVAKH